MADKEYIERETAIKAAEMACDMCTVKHICNSPGEPIDSCYSFRCAKIAVQKGYRKQSEGCKFCRTTIYIKTIQNTMPLLAPMTRADELRHELLNLTGEVYVPVEANFCPICGKKMKGV